MVASEAAGSRVGVVDADSVLCDDDEVGMLDLAARDGLISGWLFLRDLVPEAAVLDVLDLMGGRFGDESREAKGEVLVEVAVEVAPDVRGVCLVGTESVLRSDEVDDSRVSVGWDVCAALAGWAPPAAAVFADLSMAPPFLSSGASAEAEGRERRRDEESGRKRGWSGRLDAHVTTVFSWGVVVRIARDGRS